MLFVLIFADYFAQRMKYYVVLALFVCIGFASCKGGGSGTSESNDTEVIEHNNLSQDQHKMDSIKREKNRKK
jgi:hypothetical protein